MAFPVSRRPLFPGTMQPITITNQWVVDSLIALQHAGHTYVGVFCENEPLGEGEERKSELIEDLGEVRKMGTLASILRIQPIMNQQTGKPGGAQLLLKGHRRISIKDIAEQVQTLLPSPRS